MKNENAKTIDIAEDNVVEMNIKRFLDFKEFCDAVNSIVKGCFNDETGEVFYEAVDYIERIEVIGRYTDYVLPDDINEAFRIVYETDVYEKARKNIDNNQLIRLFAAAEAKLEAKEKTANATAQAGVQEMIAQFGKLSEQLKNTFGNVTAEQISWLFDAMIDGAFDEEKIVDAVMKRSKEKDEV